MPTHKVPMSIKLSSAFKITQDMTETKLYEVGLVIQEDDPHNPLNHALQNQFFKEIIAYQEGVDIMRVGDVTLIGDQIVSKPPIRESQCQNHQ